MSKSPVEKIIGLIVLYSIIIIGIFVLQFRNESVLSKNTGLLSISLAQSQAENGTLSLKNTLNVNFKGISFFADEASPLLLNIKGETKPLTLISYEQPTNLSYKFNFSDDSSVTFTVSDTTAQAVLSVSAAIPSQADGIILNYKPASGFSVTDRSKTKLQLNSKNLSYLFTAPQISDENITLTQANTVAYYTVYNPEAKFSFSSVEADMAISQKATFDEGVRQLKANLITQVSSAIHNSQGLSEKTYIAYVAELASRGRFAEAVSYVPDSFKRGNHRTYLSSPYFDRLESMYPSLIMHNESLSNMISNAVETRNLNAFTTENLAEYINILSDAAQIRKFLSLPAAVLSDGEYHLTLSQAVGILAVYTKLSALHSGFADLLSSAVEECLNVIQESCVLNDSALVLHDKDSVASSQLSLEAGTVLVQLGDFYSSDSLKRAGYALINTILVGTSLDTNSLGDVYPVLVNNAYYPHYEVLSREENNTVWAWTCASQIAYEKGRNTASMTIRFSRGESHYIIFNNIPDFTEIEIYGLSFHSDPRFETYNSSGFIYKGDNKVLFMKSRQKSENEVVRLSF